MQPLTVPATLDSLGAIAAYVMAATTAAGLDQKTAYRCRLAVDEIATNIISYGYNSADAVGRLNLQATIEAQVLKITIEDTGIAYNPCQAQLPDKAELKLPLDQRSVGGLGVYLAFQGVDQFLYERVGDRNRNILIVNRPQPA